MKSTKYGKTKAFRLPPDVNERFIESCKDLNVNQSDIIELLIIRWLRLKTKIDKRNANIYKL